MNFKTNFSKLTLLGNEKIKIYFDDKTVEFVPPNVRRYLTDLDFIEFMYILKMEPKDFSKIFNGNFVVETKYEVLMAILKTDYKTSLILQYFNELFPNIVYKESHLECNTYITSEEYDLLIEFLLVSCAELSFDSLMSKIDGGKQEEIKPLTDLEKRKLEVEEKLKKAKEKKKSQTDKKDSSITIDQIVVAILYEFPSLSIDDIYSMNMITLLDFWKYVAKVIDTQIHITAAGNGLTKDFTYFIN